MEIIEFIKKYKILISISLILCIILSGVLITVSIKAKNEEIGNVLSKAKELSNGYFYQEALDLIENSGYKDKKLESLKEEILNSKSKLCEYDGQVYHVFFHSLIVYPELAFDNDYKHEGYDMWMTTVSEFKNMLPEFYERDFILYSLKDIKAGEKIIIPEGKKPLIISIDDVNYYDYMDPDGFCDKLVVGDDGYILTNVKTPDGKVENTKDGDVMPILDEFVKEHPDFSYRGAKGIVAVTGYEGAFGYNFIKAEGEEKEKLTKEATKVATALKNTGWLIACHSYTHNDYFKDGNVGMDDLSYDTNRFKERIFDVVLQPDIYISPFGYHLGEGDERLKYLKNMGYDYFCPVSNAMRTIKTEDNVIISERFNLDRFNMRTKKEFINKTFFDVDKVYYKWNEN